MSFRKIKTGDVLVVEGHDIAFSVDRVLNLLVDGKVVPCVQFETIVGKLTIKED